MHFDNSDSRVAKHQTCVVYDMKTGKVAHIHDAITFEGGELPSRERIESRAMELAQQFASERGIKLGRLAILHVEPEELLYVSAPRVNVKTRKLVQKQMLVPTFPKPKRKGRAAKKPKAKRARARR